MTKLCIKIHMKSDSAIESAFPQLFVKPHSRIVISSEVEKSSLQAGIPRACENRNRQHQDIVSIEVHV